MNCARQILQICIINTECLPIHRHPLQLQPDGAIFNPPLRVAMYLLCPKLTVNNHEHNNHVAGDLKAIVDRTQRDTTPAPLFAISLIPTNAPFWEHYPATPCPMGTSLTGWTILGDSTVARDLNNLLPRSRFASS